MVETLGQQYVGEKPTVILCWVCFLPIRSGHQVRWTYQSGSHRISHPPSFCGACLHFSREKDSAIPFPRRTWSRILCTNDSIVLHPWPFLFLYFSFLVRKIPFTGIELTSQRVRGLHAWLPLSYRGDRVLYTYIKCHVGTPEKQQKQKQCSTSSDMVVIIYCTVTYPRL